MSSVIKSPKNFANENQVTVDERRHACPSTHALWSKLSDAQQASVSSMSNYGYELSFIRSENEEQQQVVMVLNEAVIVIDDEGTIDTHPNIHIRP